jgi:hypothetical protein
MDTSIRRLRSEARELARASAPGKSGTPRDSATRRSRARDVASIAAPRSNASRRNLVFRHTRDSLGRITQKAETVDGVTDTYAYTYL